MEASAPSIEWTGSSLDLSEYDRVSFWIESDLYHERSPGTVSLHNGVGGQVETEELFESAGQVTLHLASGQTAHSSSIYIRPEDGWINLSLSLLTGIDSIDLSDVRSFRLELSDLGHLQAATDSAVGYTISDIRGHVPPTPVEGPETPAPTPDPSPIVEVPPTADVIFEKGESKSVTLGGVLLTYDGASSVVIADESFLGCVYAQCSSDLRRFVIGNAGIHRANVSIPVRYVPSDWDGNLSAIKQAGTFLLRDTSVPTNVSETESSQGPLVITTSIIDGKEVRQSLRYFDGFDATTHSATNDTFGRELFGVETRQAAYVKTTWLEYPELYKVNEWHYTPVGIVESIGGFGVRSRARRRRRRWGRASRKFRVS